MRQVMALGLDPGVKFPLRERAAGMCGHCWDGQWGSPQETAGQQEGWSETCTADFLSRKKSLGPSLTTEETSCFQVLVLMGGLNYSSI